MTVKQQQGVLLLGNWSNESDDHIYAVLPQSPLVCQVWKYRPFVSLSLSLSLSLYSRKAGVPSFRRRRVQRSSASRHIRTVTRGPQRLKTFFFSRSYPDVPRLVNEARKR